MGFDPDALIRDALDADDRPRRSLGPPPRPSGPGPIRSEPWVGPGSEPAGADARLPAPAGPPGAGPDATIDLGGRVRTDLPGYSRGGRRACFALVPAATAARLESSRLPNEPRGRAIVRALRIADAHLPERLDLKEDPDDPWDDVTARMRRRLDEPTRLTFTLTVKEATALAALARRCGTDNLSWIITEAIEYAFGPGRETGPDGPVVGTRERPSPTAADRTG